MASLTHLPARLLLAAAASVAVAALSAVPAVSRPGSDTPGAASRTRPSDAITTVDLTDGVGRRTDVATAGLPDGPAGLAVRTGPLTTEPFVVAALTWDADDDVAPGTEISFRVREDVGWSDWLPAGVDDGYDAGPEAAAGTEPFVVGGASGVQVRVTGDPAGLPSDLELVLVAAESGSASPAATMSSGRAGSVASGGGRFSPVRIDPAALRAPSGMAGPLPAVGTTPAGDVVTRADWGADETWTDANWTPRYFPLRAAVVHHTAGSNRYDPEDSQDIVKAIFDYHTGSRGWGDIGYNYLVDQYGQVFEGRKYSLPYDVPDEVPAGWMIEAGHAYAYNKGTLGIAAMGDFTRRHAPDPAAIVAAMTEVIAWRFDEANLDADATSGLVAPDAGSTSSSTYETGEALPRILAHDDVAATQCPGDLYDELDAIRVGVSGGYERAADITPPQVTATPAGGTYPAGTSIQLDAEEGAAIFRTIDYPAGEGGLVFYSPAHADPTVPDTRDGGPISLLADLALTYVAVDSAGNTSEPVVQTYTVGAASDDPPVADAGPDRQAEVGAVVQLDGTASFDPEGGALSYVWSQTGGPGVPLEGATSATASFTPPEAGTYAFALVVSDGTSTSTPDAVSVLVTDPTNVNVAPTADAGPDQTDVPRRALVQLDGTGSSDPEGADLTYEWTQVAGAGVTLDGATTPTPSFTPKAPGEYAFALVVSDGSLVSDPDLVTVGVVK